MDYLPPYTGTVLGWAIVVGGGGALYLYYKSDARRKPIRAKTNRTTSTSSSDPQRSRAERKSTGQQSNSATATGSNTSRPSKAKSEYTARSAMADTRASDDRNDEQEDNKTWAKELAKTQQGYNFKASDTSRQQNRQKTVKQSSANRVAAELSGSSSTTGADAEGQTPSHSPELSASKDDVAVSGNVDDMLEPAADGPSVLRLTEPERHIPERQKPAPKAAPQVETKKQRQNKKKAEERKEQHEELERVRKSQLEVQRRTAREARGEPAKNGMASAAASSAWTANTPKKETPVANGNPLLDTFVTEKVTTTEAPSKEAALGIDPSKSQRSSIPSEEEQMRILMEEDDSVWKTVGTKKTKSKRKDVEEAEDGAVKPINHKVTAPASTKAASQATGAYSVLSNDDDDDDDDGWTQA